jgi:predicted amidophosphoribosyltransferase
MSRDQFRLWGNAVLDLLIPAICPACQSAAGPRLCEHCVDLLPTLINPCFWCGISQRPDQDRCLSCLGEGLPFIDRVFVSYAYDGLMAQMVSLAKAAGRPAAVAALAACMPSIRSWAQIHAANDCCVTVVPSSRGRRPGPHLGTACARQVARECGLPLRTFLRTRHLAAEQHRLSPTQRQANVKGLFYATKKVPPIIILVDDLLTTGATISAAASALRQAGAQRVVAVCLARTPHGTWERNLIQQQPLTGPTAEIV